ncbi:hypothetical protein GG344DRAFT_66685 [Lentinula edodes]|nr:hypothetical protein GG344DRAFT_66685 [Lentinula edodes]
MSQRPSAQTCAFPVCSPGSWISLYSRTFAQDPTLFTQLYLYANMSFAWSEVDKMVNWISGDQKGFQTYLKAFKVNYPGPVEPSCWFSEIQGLCNYETVFACRFNFQSTNNLGGTCLSTTPSNRTPGPTFSGNVDEIWQTANPAKAGIFHVSSLITPGSHSLEAINMLSAHDGPH